MSIVPKSRPEATRTEVIAFIQDGKPLPDFPIVVGRRGYYADSMGQPGVNDINIYDDAMWIVESDRIHAFNANCDPGRHAPRMANLKPGRWLYRIGIHGLSRPRDEQYLACVQAGPVTVKRDGAGDDTGLFGINIHCGGNGVTSSLGCQTIPPAQWGDRHVWKKGDFMRVLQDALERVGRTTFMYILTERK